MGDAERDAWLREALRHAPDSGAVPPTEISAAILAEARTVAARPTPNTAPRRSSTGPVNPLLFLWDWLARPPVAAGFASVMAATLVGLMWWDRPMDESLPHPPALERSEAKTGTASVPVDAASTTAAPIAPPAPATTAAPATAPVAPAQTPATPARIAAAREAKVGDAANAKRVTAKDDAPAKERSALRKDDAPAAFPSAEVERASRPAPQAAAADANKEFAAGSAPATAPKPAPAPFAATERATPAPAAPTVPAPPKLPSGRLANDQARLAASNRADSNAATATGSAVPPGTAAEPAGDLATPATGPTVRPRSNAEARPNEADALASSGAGARNEQQARELRRDGAGAATAPLAPLLAGNSTRATRQSASGGASALEPAWRDWLADLDAATATRWRRLADFRQQAGAGGDTEKQATTALRLNVDGRPAAVVRIDGTTARVEILGPVAEHWQATLAPGAAERLRAALAHLPP